MSKDKGCFAMENLVATYKLPKDYFSEGSVFSPGGEKAIRYWRILKCAKREGNLGGQFCDNSLKNGDGLCCKSTKPLKEVKTNLWHSFR